MVQVDVESVDVVVVPVVGPKDMATSVEKTARTDDTNLGSGDTPSSSLIAASEGPPLPTFLPLYPTTP